MWGNGPLPAFFSPLPAPMQWWTAFNSQWSRLDVKFLLCIIVTFSAKFEKRPYSWFSLSLSLKNKLIAVRWRTCFPIKLRADVTSWYKFSLLSLTARHSNFGMQIWPNLETEGVSSKWWDGNEIFSAYTIKTAIEIQKFQKLFH